MPPPKKKFAPFEAIDEDLWYEIFKRLPIKNLCRLRCVCKWFNSLISSPHFIDLHYSLARSATPPHLKPYLHVKANRGDLIDLRFPVPALNDVVEHSKQPLYFPFRTKPKRVTFLGVIHGVVCISYKSSSSSLSVILWNPTIHKYVALPRLRLSVKQSYALGFGYDTSRKDFKVVLIQVPQWTYNVYSNQQVSWSRPRGFKLDSPDSPWPKADGIKASWCFNGKDTNSPCFVNGTIHWGLSLHFSRKDGFSNVQSSNSVLMFDCESEEFRRISLPAKLFWAWPVPVKVFEYAGMIAALVDRVLWVMEEHGVATSWKKLCSISKEGPIVIYDPSLERMAPYGPSNTWNMIKGCILDIRDISTEIASDHVYDETMVLMDDSKAQSYTNQEIVTILSS